MSIFSGLRSYKLCQTNFHIEFFQKNNHIYFDKFSRKKSNYRYHNQTIANQNKKFLQNFDEICVKFGRNFDEISLCERLQKRANILEPKQSEQYTHMTSLHRKCSWNATANLRLRRYRIPSLKIDSSVHVSLHQVTWSHESETGGGEIYRNLMLPNEFLMKPNSIYDKCIFFL
jgi:hypothetical protein